MEKSKSEQSDCVNGDEEGEKESCNEVLEAPEVSQDSVMETMIALSKFTNYF